ncbi:MAG TPA: DUF2829 domain-containing protein [Bacteroides mediterraneensis]|jgi:hypothetical protein|uniref:DUF2829 domain-containing protein n=1 Tax=Bacteroides mediterraneensis TaxID=1841856 RepID=UPI0026EC096C|nr:DUF2829 domain-containing protein [Bacteroides mediterraneensis]HJH64761.1 DUF2829 domain-containing protein [Bacteroides mediterraneensis]
MRKYIGTKQVEAMPMTLGEYIAITGRNPYVFDGEMHGGNEPGYLVNEDGREGWTPAKTFEEAYRQVDDERKNMTFGDAIEVLKQGGAIRRTGWNGKGLFVVKQVPAHIDSDVIPKMQSLPQSAKDLILKGKGFIDYTSQCLIYNENTGRADSWVPSISDVFAEDWEIVQ